MVPNIFLYDAHCREDYFSHSLAYVLNMFPPLGEALVRRIARLAGKDPELVGRFQTCEFIAHEFSQAHTASKPDLKFVCSKSIIYFENKLDAPLSIAQMQQHALLARGRRRCYLVFVSNINHQSPALRSMSRYIHPKGRDHYQWVDLLPALDGAYRKSSVAARVLGDFRTALKRQGMIGRTIKGAAGSLYTSGSQACHLALQQLWEQLRALGFTLDRKRNQESTLRIYATPTRQYPLLNPRFEATAGWLKADLDFECLIITALSRANGAISHRLANFPSQHDCEFVPNPFQNIGYTYHGHFVLPVKFAAHGASGSIDFHALQKPLTKLLAFLTASFSST